MAFDDLGVGGQRPAHLFDRVVQTVLDRIGARLFEQVVEVNPVFRVGPAPLGKGVPAHAGADVSERPKPLFDFGIHGAGPRTASGREMRATRSSSARSSASARCG